jgi:hypothetical protein
MFGRADSVSFDRDPVSRSGTNTSEIVPSPSAKSVEPAVAPAVELTRCFLRLANMSNYALDRLSRYEATLWRQVVQMLFALDALDRRKPQERKGKFFISNERRPSEHRSHEY